MSGDYEFKIYGEDEVVPESAFELNCYEFKSAKEMFDFIDEVEAMKNASRSYEIYRRSRDGFERVGIDKLNVASVIVIPTRDAYEQFIKDAEDAPEDFFMGRPINSIGNVFETGIYYYNAYCGQFINKTILEDIVKNFDSLSNYFAESKHD